MMWTELAPFLIAPATHAREVPCVPSLGLGTVIEL